MPRDPLGTGRPRAVHARPLTTDDAATLEAIDSTATERAGQDRMLNPGSISFYARSGHAFVAVREGRPCGFVLAQAVWDGSRPVVRVRPLAVADVADDEAREALLEAVTKSAYDAAVYDLVADAAEGDHRTQALLERIGWRPEPVRPFRLTLGSRGTS